MITEEEAKAIARSVGKLALEFAASIVAPLYWAQRGEDDSISARNGTAFFLRTPEALFGVTAAHVVEGPGGWRESCVRYGMAPLRLGAKNGASVELRWDARCVDIDLDIDIATFTISPREIEAIERVPYGGLQTMWPPPPPRLDVGVTYAGFPGVGTRNLSRAAVQFGILCGTGLVSSVNECEISTLLERDYLEPTLGEGIVPENYNFGGISGGPLIYNVLTKGQLLVNALGGVIVSGPNPSIDCGGVHTGLRAVSGTPSRLHPLRRLARPRSLGGAPSPMTRARPRNGSMSTRPFSLRLDHVPCYLLPPARASGAMRALQRAASLMTTLTDCSVPR